MGVDLLINVGTYLLIGVFAGLLAGILGLGGGMIVVPGLLFIFRHNHLIAENLVMHVATSTSLATMIFTSFSAIRMHNNKGTILWKVYQRLWLGLILGVSLGVIIALQIPSDWLSRLFAIFLFYIAYKLYKNMNAEYIPKTPNPMLDKIISTIIGFISGLLGVGGGTMIIPYLLYNGVPIRKTAPLSGLCTITLALTGTLISILAGLSVTGLPKYSLGFIYLPAVLWVVLPSYFFTPLGVKLTYILPVKHLQYLFIVMVIGVAISMILTM